MTAQSALSYDAVARRNMALGQLITNTVNEPHILNAMLAVPREQFVPQALSGAAYVDDELPLGQGRFLMAPLPFARLLALADLKPTDRVLDVGCAYGYSTAVIARLCAEVIGCESDASMAAAAKQNMAKHHVTNAEIVQVQHLREGYDARAPYDVIVIEGAIAAAPAPLLRLLASSGRLVTVEHVAGKSALPGVPGGLGCAVAFVHHDGAFLRKPAVQANVPILTGFEAPSGFVF